MSLADWPTLKDEPNRNQDFSFPDPGLWESFPIMYANFDHDGICYRCPECHYTAKQPAQHWCQKNRPKKGPS